MFDELQKKINMICLPSVKMQLIHNFLLTAIGVFFLTLPGNSSLNANDGFVFDDDGFSKPYKPPKFQTDYMKTIPVEFHKYFKVDPNVLEQWQDGKFGVFMHWDPSCQITGSISWKRKGPRPHHGGKGNPIRGIPEKIYNSQYKTFNPVDFNADTWIKMIKDAGAKYFVFTAKHHNGFCMFDTPTTEYCIRNTPYKKDICAELAVACHKYGIMLFWYYSEPDWTEPRYRADFNTKEFDSYLYDYMYPQLKQLVTKYGYVDGIWFDGLGLPAKVWKSHEMIKMLRTLNPKLLINNRFSFAPMRLGDFDSPENQIGRFQINRPWETCICLGGTWGYQKKAIPLSEKDAIRLLVKCAGNGGNLLLNTGPSPKGIIHPSHIERYLQMGKWLNKYGESIYETRGGPYTPGLWGCSTRGKNSNFVYLHLFEPMKNGKLQLPYIGTSVLSVKHLSGSSKIKFLQNGNSLILSTDTSLKSDDDKMDMIIRLELDKKATSLPVVKTTQKNFRWNKP